MGAASVFYLSWGCHGTGSRHTYSLVFSKTLLTVWLHNVHGPVLDLKYQVTKLNHLTGVRVAGIAFIVGGLYFC